MTRRGEPITDPDKLEKAFQYAKHDLEIEGFTLTKEDEKNMKAVASGEMTREELIEKLKRGE
ncbi:hypothetical protein SAMN05421676_108132 [Salinibacillus kushneri]|uniref:Antitoxin VbhA domain-containing protein n=1 Tax=Salinibacillus kushneri TaxID=237682 RepID=A0A1I0HAM0_9BACI|nr:antitoxin VbhA family protein [Salinibacillus kushneri]SET80701.1 hypothetical protein SAMN05421676_108132 [Salinibacillus kushneri]